MKRAVTWLLAPACRLSGCARKDQDTTEQKARELFEPITAGE